MAPVGAYRKKTCTKCSKCLKVYLTCFKCDAVYHAKCLLKLPGFQMDQNGHAYCCRNITSESDSGKEVLASQEKLVVVKREEEYGSDKDLENCSPDVEDSERDKFKCEACYLKFTNKEHLEGHYRKCPYIMQGGSIQETNRDKAGLVCSFCNEENFQEDSYEQHIKQCEEHHSRLNKVDDIRTTIMKGKHGNVHNKERLFKCNKCDYATKRGHFLTYHIVSKHHDRKKRSTNIEYTLERHLRAHTNQKPFKCNRCDYRTALKRSLKIHMKLKHFNTKKDAAAWKANLRPHILVKRCNPEKKYKCSKCKFSTDKQSSIAIHTRIHTKERPFKCDICNYAATSKSRLNEHVLTKHSDVEKKYKCSRCKYSAHNKWSLVKHIGIHERPFKCDICNYAAARNTDLKSHIMRMHTNERPFKCGTCSYVASRSKQLNDHILAKHSNAEKMHKCGYCTYATHLKSHLTKHIRTHANEKPFKCDTCDYAAARRSYLNLHITAKHSNAEKKYKCSDCKYSTNYKAHLARHMHIHTNEKSFKCNVCDYASTRRDNLTCHILGKHSDAEKKFECGGAIANIPNIPLAKNQV